MRYMSDQHYIEYFKWIHAAHAQGDGVLLAENLDRGFVAEPGHSETRSKPQNNGQMRTEQAAIRGLCASASA